MLEVAKKVRDEILIRTWTFGVLVSDVKAPAVVWSMLLEIIYVF